MKSYLRQSDISFSRVEDSYNKDKKDFGCIFQNGTYLNLK